LDNLTQLLDQVKKYASGGQTYATFDAWLVKNRKLFDAGDKAEMLFAEVNSYMHATILSPANPKPDEKILRKTLNRMLNARMMQ
jgi:hypothetical protein